MQYGAEKRGRSADRIAVEKFQLDRGDHRLDLGAGPEPLVNGSHVRADGVDAQTERQANVLIAVPVREQLEDLALPIGNELVHHGAARTDSGHLRGASPSTPEHQLRNERRHRDTPSQQLSNGIGKAEQFLSEQVAAGAGLDHGCNALLVNGARNDQQGSPIRAEQRRQLRDGCRPRVVEGDDDDVGLHARELVPPSGERLSHPNLEVAVANQDLLRATVVQPDQENSGDGSVNDARVANTVHLVPRSHDEQSVRPELRAPQGFVTCFAFATKRPPETLTVYRLSSLRDVEFWSLVGGQRERTQLSDMFSASLVLGSSKEECGRAWTRVQERGFRPGDVLLADAGEVQRTTLAVDRPGEFFTIYWQREALERVAAELGFSGPPHWALTRLAAGTISAELARLRSSLESGDALSVEQAYRSATAALLRSAGQGMVSAAPPPRSHPGMERAAERVRTSLAEPLSLSDLASEMRMSKYYLAHSFQHSLGAPPHRYRKLLRIQYARRLLERGLTVDDVALQTGFADAPHLSRVFSEWLGVSPSAWRNAWRACDPWHDPARPLRLRASFRTPSNGPNSQQSSLS
jgi:AraC-like DNA-binding protein